jgi:methionyl-tRNA formyltransferase
LPAYGGVESEFWALYEGQAEAWATFHRVTAELDSGGIVAEVPVAVAYGEDEHRLHERLVDAAAAALPNLLDEIAENGVTVVREPGPATLRPWPRDRERRELRRRLRRHGDGRSTPPPAGRVRDSRPPDAG